VLGALGIRDIAACTAAGFACCLSPDEIMESETWAAADRGDGGRAGQGRMPAGNS
jgi:hypothetical protein